MSKPLQASLLDGLFSFRLVTALFSDAFVPELVVPGDAEELSEELHLEDLELVEFRLKDGPGF